MRRRLALFALSAGMIVTAVEATQANFIRKLAGCELIQDYYEKRGYYCPKKPPLVPCHWWYPATCARRVR